MNSRDEKTEGRQPSFSIKRKDFSILVAQAELFNCEVLCQMLKQQGYNVVGRAVEMEDTLQQIRVKQPQCVILESEISGQQSVDIVRQTQTDYTRTKFILYTSKPDFKLMARAMQQGFYGFLYAKDGLDELFQCFQTIDSGGYYYSPGFMSLLKNYGMNIIGEDKRQELQRLSSRERAILRLVAEGVPGTEIADQLHISYRTLANHKTNIVQKLNLASCRQLARYGISVKEYL